MPEGHEQHPMRRPENSPASSLLGCGSVAALLVWGLAILAVTAGLTGGTVVFPPGPFFWAGRPAPLGGLRDRDGRGGLPPRPPPPPPPGGPPGAAPGRAPGGAPSR